MKILVIVYSLTYGGAERQAVMDANALSECGYRVTLAYHRTGALLNLVSGKIKLYRIKFSNIALASLQLFLYLLFNKYDVIHSHMFWAEKISALSGKITGHNVIFNEHGLGLWRRWYHILVMQFISLFANKIITSCDANRNIRIKREKLSRKKVITIYNSYDKISNTKSTINTAKLNKKDKIFTIGFVGRFDAVKRLPMFLNIAEQLKHRIPELRIVLVGDGEEMDHIKRELIKRALKPYFLLPGYILYPEQYYEVFDIFVLPSRIEGFSVALLEAGACEVPAIVFDVGGNSEIIRDGITGYVIPDSDMDLLLKRVVHLYKHKSRRTEMGSAAKHFIEDNFSVWRRLSSLMELYTSLC